MCFHVFDYVTFVQITCKSMQYVSLENQIKEDKNFNLHWSLKPNI